jgi:lipopolysaccharide transport system ATP-binding protein
VNRTVDRLLGRQRTTAPATARAVSERDDIDADGGFWALRDVCFEVEPGEVLGIIGRNGSGKSTLLKVLSEITAPSSGRVEIGGRVASLLEVGTGFHPELSGRDNVYLNGAILGMTKAEVRRKFDEIVAFAEVEEFIDTPVKRYSSGMYVRLAFAVAAHLEPEILLVDEVLAVGDQSFQTKCTRQMEGTARQGKTVVVVSHNLSTVQTLCTRVVQLHAGSLVGDGDPKEQVGLYLKRLAQSGRRNLLDRLDREGNGRARLTNVSVLDGFGNLTESIHTGDSLEIQLEYQSRSPGNWPEAAISIWSSDGVKILHVDNAMRGQSLPHIQDEGTYTCRFPRLNLSAGRYYVNALIKVDGELADHVHWVAEFHVQDGDYYKIGAIARSGGGLVLIDHEWR